MDTHRKFSSILLGFVGLLMCLTLFIYFTLLLPMLTVPIGWAVLMWWSTGLAGTIAFITSIPSYLKGRRPSLRQKIGLYVGIVAATPFVFIPGLGWATGGSMILGALRLLTAKEL